MKYLDKTIFLIGVLLLTTGAVFAAPASTILRNILPEANNTYQIGSTTPAAQWLTVFSRDSQITNATSTNLYSTSIGASTNRIPNVYATNVDATTALIGSFTPGDGVFSGDLYVNGGDFALGTGSATTTLTISATAFAIAANATTTLGTTGLNIGSGQFVVQQTSGNVGIGTAGPGARLHVDDTIYVGTGVGTQGGNNNLIKTGAGSAYLNLKGGAGTAYISIADSSTYFGGSNVIVEGNVEFSIWDGSPTAQLEVSQDGGTSQSIFALSSDDSVTGDRFIVTGTGNVGIGTTTPATTLSVQGNALISGNLNSVANITATGTLALTGTTGTSTIASGQGFTIGTSQFVVQQTSGNVGIGTTSPATELSIQAGANATTTIHMGINTAGYGTCIQWYAPNGTAYREYVNNGGTKTLEAGSCK